MQILDFKLNLCKYLKKAENDEGIFWKNFENYLMFNCRKAAKSTAQDAIFFDVRFILLPAFLLSDF